MHQEPLSARRPSSPLSPDSHMICDRFEAAWQAGERPRIEDYLGDMPASEIVLLLTELIALDVTYRRRAGDDPGADEYHARFPEVDPVQLAGIMAAPSAAFPAATPTAATPQPTLSRTESHPELPVPQALKDLETPPPLAEAIQQELARCYFFNRHWKRWVEEELKLQYYYGGLDVVCQETGEGRVVLAAGVPGTGELRRAIDSVDPAERHRLCVISVDPWDDPEIMTGLAFIDEA